MAIERANDGAPPSYPPEYFAREDPADDRLFYAQPRLVVHVDEHAVETIRSYLGEVLPKDGAILDLMSSWRSHLPEPAGARRVTGLGLNAIELAENPQLDDRVVHDLNAKPVLPFAEGCFDAAVVTVSVQYMVKPLEVFAEVLRVLKHGASFHVIYSDRMFLTKAVAIWRALNDEQHAALIGSYFQHSGKWLDVEALDISPRLAGYSEVEALDISPRLAGSTDPVYVVRASKPGSLSPPTGKPGTLP